MTSLYVALDVLSEAIARRYMIALFAVISAFLVLLLFALNLEVVDGALAATRLFGKQVEGAPMIAVDVALAGVFQALAWVVFYGGLIFGIVVTADIAPRMLAPGRVELLLSLPVRRVELVVGTYLGVLAICVLATAFATGGVAAVLFFKAEFFTVAPLAGALGAVLGFMAVYAVMLLAATLVRSAALAAGTGLLFFLGALLTSDRERFLSFFEEGVIRSVLSVVITVLPKLADLAEAGGQAAQGLPILPGTLWAVVGGTIVFAAACIALASFVVSGKDY